MKTQKKISKEFGRLSKNSINITCENFRKNSLREYSVSSIASLLSLAQGMLENSRNYYLGIFIEQTNDIKYGTMIGYDTRQVKSAYVRQSHT